MDNLKVIQRILGDQVTNVKRIHHGVSNNNYLVDKKYVVRVKEEKEYFYSYQHEKEILHLTARLYLSDIVRYLDKDGNKVSDYIPGTHIFSKKDEEIKKAALLIRKLHSADINTHIKFDPFTRYKYYRKNSQGETFKHEELILKETKKLYHKYNLILCHNDLVDNNFLFTKDRAYLIDYEFAGKNIYLFDLASFITENNITDKNKIRLFLSTYGFNFNLYNDLRVMMMFLNLLWYYWALERYQVTKKRIYQNIAKEKKKRIVSDVQAIVF